MKFHRSSLAKPLIKILPFLIILTVTLIALRQVLFTSGLVMWGDFFSPLTTEKWLGYFYPLWHPYGSHPALNVGYLWFVAPTAGVASALHISMEVVAKGIIFLIFLLAGLSMYYAVSIVITTIKKVNKNRKDIFVASITAALVYMFNPWAMNRVTHYFFLFSYALAPIVFACFVKSLQTRKMVHIVATAFLLSLISSSPHYIIFFGILILSWLVFSLLYSFKTADKLRVLNDVKTTSLVIVFFLAFNAFWIVPQFISGVTTPRYLMSCEGLESLSRNSSMMNVIRSMGYWSPSTPSFYEPSSKLLYYPWLIGSFMVPLFAFAALLLKPKNKYVLFFSLMSIPLIFLTMGTQSPISQAYPWLVFDVPFFSDRFGWIFRDPDKWGGLLALVFCFLISFTILGIFQRGRKSPGSIKVKSIPIVMTLFFFSFFTIFAGPAVENYLGGYFVPQKMPEEYYTTNKWLEEQSSDFKVSWLPGYGGQATTWGCSVTGSFNYWASTKPNLGYIGAITPLTGYYYQYAYSESLLNNETVYFGKYLDILGARYLLFHSDIVGLEEQANTAINYLKKQKDLKFIEQRGFIYIFGNEGYAPQVSIPTQNLIVIGGLDLFTSLNAVDSFNPARTGLVFSNLLAGMDPNCIRYSDGIILKSDVEDLFLPLDNAILIAPFEYTRHVEPERVWSRMVATGAETWHPYLEIKGIKNWDLDMGKGLAFTWVPSVLKEPACFENEDLVIKFDFEGRDLEGWTGEVPSVHKFFLSDDAREGKHSLLAELYESTPCWYMTASPLIPVEHGGLYRVEFHAKGEDAHAVHTWIVEFDEGGNELGGQYMGEWGSGNFGWKDVFHDFTPLSPDASYVQLRIQYGYQTPRPLPHKVWIDDVRIYNLKRFVEPNSLVMPFEAIENKNYELWVRYFQSEKGGKIGIRLDDGQNKTFDTKDQINGFVWQKVGGFDLKKGEHKLTLQNMEGFNAVNIFALIPYEARIEKEVYDLLGDKRIVYVLEAESSLYRGGAEKSREFGGEASNGEVLLFTPNSKVWRVLKVLRDTQYRIALRLEGSFKVKIDNQTFQVDSRNLDFVYPDPIHMKKGSHELEIEPLPILEPIEWDFETREDLQEWKNVTPETDIHKISLENGALKAELYGSTWGWKTINSPLVLAEYGAIYNWELHVKGEDAHDVHVKIAEYDTNREFIRDHYVASVGDGNFDWKMISLDFTPQSPNIAYMQLQIWHGHETEKPLPNMVWVDNIKVTGCKENNYLDVIWVYSIERENETLEDILLSKEIPAAVINYTRINPTKYKVEVNAINSFMLAFTEAYDPLWVARVNGKEYKSLPLYSVINGFWIDEMGELEITVEYKPQRWFYYGALISIISLLGTVVYLTRKNLFEMLRWGKRKVKKYWKTTLREVRYGKNTVY